MEILFPADCSWLNEVFQIMKTIWIDNYMKLDRRQYETKWLTMCE